MQDPSATLNNTLWQRVLKRVSTKPKSRTTDGTTNPFWEKQNRHENLGGQRYRQSWKAIQKNCGPSMKWKIHGGEPDVVSHDKTDEFLLWFTESPQGRRSYCYDQTLESRKKFKPENNASMWQHGDFQPKQSIKNYSN
jgi:hypothetical protein